MRRNYRLIQENLHFEAAFFLGDLFDSGRKIEENLYEEELQRFNKIFHKIKEFPVYNVSGNHDIGYRIGPKQAALATKFEENFGPLNYKVTVGGFTFVTISSLTVEEEISIPKELSTQTINFIESLNSEDIYPSILLTHVPLWRPRNTHCGSENKEHGPLVDRIGGSYRNMLDKGVSEHILEKVKPVHVFSGDDHDICEVQHSETTTEHTVGTFSWLQGVTHPSFAVVSLIHSEKNSTVVVDICFLPNMYALLSWYLILVPVSVWFASPGFNHQGLVLLGTNYSPIQSGARGVLQRVLYSIPFLCKRMLFILLPSLCLYFGFTLL